MALKLTKKQLFEAIQALYPGLGPNKDYSKFKEAAFEAFYHQIGIQKENVNAVAMEKIFTFVEIFVKNFKRLWNLRNNKKHFLNMLRNHAGFFEKVWNFEDVLNPPLPPPVIPAPEAIDVDETGDALGLYYIYLYRSKVDI